MSDPDHGELERTDEQHRRSGRFRSENVKHTLVKRPGRIDFASVQFLHDAKKFKKLSSDVTFLLAKTGQF